ncbi:MAG: hypothetical protein EBU93_06275 [Chlamydiae bacterium]|nr:hypothetical protein [Chlamydiota bacterium]
MDERKKDVEIKKIQEYENLSTALDSKLEKMHERIFTALLDSNAELSYDFFLPMINDGGLVHSVLEIFKLNFRHFGRESEIASFENDMDWPDNKKLTVLKFLVDILCPKREQNAPYHSYDIRPTFYYYSSFKIHFTNAEMEQARPGQPAYKLKNMIDEIKNQIKKCTPKEAPSDLLESKLPAFGQPKQSRMAHSFIPTEFRPAVDVSAPKKLRDLAKRHSEALKVVKAARKGEKRERSSSRSSSRSSHGKTQKKNKQEHPGAGAKKNSTAKKAVAKKKPIQQQQARRGFAASKFNTNPIEEGEVDDIFQSQSRSRSRDRDEIEYADTSPAYDPNRR